MPPWPYNCQNAQSLSMDTHFQNLSEHTIPGPGADCTQGVASVLPRKDSRQQRAHMRHGPQRPLGSHRTTRHVAALESPVTHSIELPTVYSSPGSQSPGPQGCRSWVVELCGSQAGAPEACRRLGTRAVRRVPRDRRGFLRRPSRGGSGSTRYTRIILYQFRDFLRTCQERVRKGVIPNGTNAAAARQLTSAGWCRPPRSTSAWYTWKQTRKSDQSIRCKMRKQASGRRSESYAEQRNIPFSLTHFAD